MRNWILVIGLVLAGCTQDPGHVPKANVPPPATNPAERFLSRQKECLEFTAPADKVIYTEEPAEVRALPKGEDGYQLVSVTQPHRYDFVMLRVKPFRELQKQGAQVNANWPGAGLQPQPLVHGLTAADGREYLVAMELFPFDKSSLDLSVMMQQPFRAGEDLSDAANSDPRSPHARCAQVVHVPIAYIPPLAGKPLRLYGAQFDPADKSHFTIRYVSGEKEGRIEGRFFADPNPRVEVAVKSGPLMP